MQRQKCAAEFSYLQGSYFWTKYNCSGQPQNCTSGSDYDKEQRHYHQFQWLFKERKNHTHRPHHHHHGDPLSPDEAPLINQTIYDRSSKDCREYLGTGAIALISYIFAFLAFLLVIKNVASNKLPIMDGGVYVCTIMTGIWGLIATAMFGDLFGRSEGHFPLGHQFAIFTTSWILFFIVGVTGVRDAKDGFVTETAAATRSALFVAALVGFAYAMGNDWYVHDNQDLIVPLGGFQWTLKTGRFFIAPASHANFINNDTLLHYAQNKDSNNNHAVWCDDEDPLLPNTSVPADATHLRNPDSDLAHLAGQKNKATSGGPGGVGRRSGGDRKGKVYDDVSDHPKNEQHTRNHYPNQCLLPARPTVVRGMHNIGLWKECYCKRTTSLTCNLFGSSWAMLNGRDMACSEFNVARAMILMVGIFSFLALMLSSMLIGGMRRVNVHIISNNLCMLSGLLGLISSILFGAVVYDVKKLSADFALYLAGWWLVFLAGCIGVPVTAYYEEVQNTGKVIPMQAIPADAQATTA